MSFGICICNLRTLSFSEMLTAKIEVLCPEAFGNIYNKTTQQVHI